MPPASPRTQRLGIRRGIGVALLCWAVLGALQLLQAFDLADLRLLDLRFQLRGPRPASDHIAIVEIDDATVEDYQRWPLTRDQYALLSEALASARARVVGMDLLFLGNDAANPRFDDLLAQVTALHSNLVHAITFVSGLRAREPAARPRPEIEARLVRHGLVADGIPAREAPEVTTPEPGLLEAAAALGHVVLQVDPDGEVRRLPLLVRHEGRLYPCLALSVYGLATGGGPLPRLASSGRTLRLEWPGHGALEAPLDAEGCTSVDFAGDRDAFPHAYSMVDVLRWYAAGDSMRLRRTFENRVVLVGATAVAQVATDVSSTPFSTNTPLLFVHANALDSFLRGRFVTRTPAPLLLLVLAVLAVVLGWLFVGLSMPWAAAVAALGLILVAAADQAAFVWRGWDVPPTAGLLLPPLAYAAIASYRYIFLEGRARERQRELKVAHGIQQRLLPTEPPRFPGLDVFGVNRPAQEIGGDYYDWIRLGGGRLLVGVGDVSGKGVPAALLMSHLHASLHAAAREELSPSEIAHAVHASLHQAIEAGRFATFFLVSLEHGRSELWFCNAGHNPPFLVRDGRCEMLGATGVPLGMFDEVTYKDERRPFGPGDVLVVYSDGVTECPHKDDMYGEDRLRDLVLGLCARGLGAREMVEAVVADVTRFARGPAFGDDLTVVVVKRT